MSTLCATATLSRTDLLTRLSQFAVRSGDQEVRSQADLDYTTLSDLSPVGRDTVPDLRASLLTAQSEHAVSAKKSMWRAAAGAVATTLTAGACFALAACPPLAATALLCEGLWTVGHVAHALWQDLSASDDKLNLAALERAEAWCQPTTREVLSLQPSQPREGALVLH
jgi:hypothetical protein